MSEGQVGCLIEVASLLIELWQKLVQAVSGILWKQRPFNHPDLQGYF